MGVTFYAGGGPTAMQVAETLSLLQPLPSEIRWLEDNMVFESLRDIIFERFMQILLNTYSQTEQIDTVWTSGIQLRKCFQLFSKEQQDAIRGLDTEAANVWLNGVDGRDAFHGIDE